MAIPVVEFQSWGAYNFIYFYIEVNVFKGFFEQHFLSEHFSMLKIIPFFEESSFRFKIENAHY